MCSSDLATARGVDAGGQLWLVPSSIKASDIARVLRQGYDVEVLNEGVRELAEGLDLDVLVIDTHPGLNEETLLSITISDVLLLILRPDKQDYQGTAVTVDIARRLEVPELLLLVNKVPRGFHKIISNFLPHHGIGVTILEIEDAIHGHHARADAAPLQAVALHVFQHARGELFIDGDERKVGAHHVRQMARSLAQAQHRKVRDLLALAQARIGNVADEKRVKALPHRRLHVGHHLARFQIFEVTVLIGDAANLGYAVQLDLRARILDLVQKRGEKSEIGRAHV